MINIFPLPDLLAAVAVFWCDLLTTQGILLRQRDTVRTVGLTRDVGGAKETLHQPLPRPRVSRMCSWAHKLAWRGKKRSELLCRELAFPQQLEVVFCFILLGSPNNLFVVLA